MDPDRDYYLLRIDDVIIGYDDNLDRLNDALLKRATALRDSAQSGHTNTVTLDVTREERDGHTRLRASVVHMCWTGARILHRLSIDPVKRLQH
jgi:hypothetical protein